MDTQPQAPAAPPQPSDQFVIKAYREENQHLIDNRMYLIASMAEMQHEAQTEINRLNGVIASILSMVDDENRQKVAAFLDEPQDAEAAQTT